MVVGGTGTEHTRSGRTVIPPKNTPNLKKMQTAAALAEIGC